MQRLALVLFALGLALSSCQLPQGQNLARMRRTMFQGKELDDDLWEEVMKRYVLDGADEA
jgi:hypothetical protein